MPIIFGKAPGKIILFGEHAVVHGRPAIAIPVSNVAATARIIPIIDAQPGIVHLEAPDIELNADLDSLPDDHPLATAVRMTLDAVSPGHIPSLRCQITSTIPISAGMGSGAAVTVATVRALSSFLGASLSDAEISDIAFNVEKIHHGTPSGIDNTVIAYQQPVYYQQHQPIQIIKVNRPTCWVIGDTGERVSTKTTVADVHARHQADPAGIDSIFDAIGEITDRARQALIDGDLDELGPLLNENQRLLRELGVSSEKLEILIRAAREAGAAGAKLSGGGRGGNMIALASQENSSNIETALWKAGAARVITTTLRETVP